MEFNFDTYTGQTIAGVGGAALRFYLRTGDELAEMNDALAHMKRAKSGARPPQETEPGVLPLHEIVLADKFPYKPGDFEQPKAHSWNPEACKQFGKFAVKVLDAGPERSFDRQLTRRHIQLFHTLGIGCGYPRIHSQFFTMGSFRKTLGLPVGKAMNQYDKWSETDFAHYAARVERMVERRPEASDYSRIHRESKGKDNAPGLRIINEHAGGVSALNELIGYPNIRAWEDDDYIDWGLRVLRSNDPDYRLSVPLLDVLSGRKRGPSASDIGRRFGIVAFQKIVEERRAPKEWLGLYDQLVKRRIFPPAESNLPAARKAIIAMRYRLVQRCLPNVEQGTLVTLAHTKKSVAAEVRKQSNNTVSIGHIQMLATSMNIFDHLWPKHTTSKTLYVSPEELTEARAAERRSYNRRRAKRQDSNA